MKGNQLEALKYAMCEAFDQESLEIMLRTRLDKTLAEIVSPSRFDSVVFNLIRVAIQEGWEQQLIRAACDYVPNSPAMRRFVQKYQGDNETAEQMNLDAVLGQPATQAHTVQLHDIIRSPHILSNERVGAYIVRGLVGTGGSGLVYRAIHGATGAEVCLKLLYPVTGRARAIMGAISRGVRAINAVNDPHVIRITDFAEAPFQDCATWYLVMEYTSGGRD